jgi:tripartite-type tricarboxylate transporter receptor subunit TctC
MRRRAFAGAALGASVAALGPRRPAAAPQAAGFPNRPIRIISPYPPGGGTDTTARLIGPPMSEFLGQPIVVENRPGAGGAIGAGHVAEQPPDGHTLLVDSLGHVVNPHLLRGLRFDYATAFAPVSLVTVLRQILVVPPSVPANSVAEFVAWAKARPGRLSWGSSGNATGSHLAGVLFTRAAGLDMTHVPYRGGSAVLPDLLSGNIVFAFATVSVGSQLVRDGRLKGLAIASRERVASLPGIATMAELGFPMVDMDEWNVLTSPAGTPPAVLARLHEALRHALARPNVQERFAQIGAVTVGSPPEEAARFVAERREALGRLVREAGITIE